MTETKAPKRSTKKKWWLLGIGCGCGCSLLLLLLDTHFSDLLPATEYGVWCYAETKDGVPMKEKPKEKVLFVTTDVSGHSIFV